MLWFLMKTEGETCRDDISLFEGVANFLQLHHLRRCSMDESGW